MYGGNDLVDIWLGVLRGRRRGHVVFPLPGVVAVRFPDVLLVAVVASPAANRRMQTTSENRMNTIVTRRIGSCHSRKRGTKDPHRRHEHSVHPTRTTQQRNHMRRTHILILMLPSACVLLLLPCELELCLRRIPLMAISKSDLRVGGAAETVAGDATNATRKTRKRARSCKCHEVTGRTCTEFGLPLCLPGVLLLPEQRGGTMNGNASSE